MQAKAVSIIALRILGIYCFIESMLSTRYALAILTGIGDTPEGNREFLMAALPVAVILLVSAFILIVFARKLAGWLTPIEAVEGSSWKSDPTEIQPMLFAVAGVMIFAHAIPTTFTWISQLVTVVSFGMHNQYDSRFVRDAWISGILSALQFFIAIGLFVGGRSLSKLWQKFRSLPEH